MCGLSICMCAHMCKYVEARGQHWMSSLFYLIFETVPHPKTQRFSCVVWPVRFRDPPVSAPPSYRVANVCHPGWLLTWTLEMETQAPVLTQPTVGPLSYFLSPLFQSKLNTPNLKFRNPKSRTFWTSLRELNSKISHLCDGS